VRAQARRHGVDPTHPGAVVFVQRCGSAIHIPNIPALIGVRLHSALVTLDSPAPSGIQSISNTFSFSITKQAIRALPAAQAVGYPEPR